MALTSKVDYSTTVPTRQTALEAAGNDTYYKGAMLVANADGYADVPSDAAALMPVGVYTGKAEDGVLDDAYAVANGEHPKLVLEQGPVWIPKGDAAQTDVGLFYLAGDDTLTGTKGSKTWAVRCIAWKTGYVLIDFGAPVYTG